MELIFELIFEIIVEGSLELGVSKKIPWPVRMLALAVFLLIYGALIGLFFFVAMGQMNEGNTVAAVFFISVDIFLAFGVIWAIVKKYREHNKK